MKNYESFDLWFEGQTLAWQKLIKMVRQFIKKDFDELEETIKWTNGCWLYKERPIVYLHTEKNYIQVGFFAGTLLKDPGHRLEGKGKHVRFMMIREKKDLDLKYLSKLIKQAIKLYSARS